MRMKIITKPISSPGRAEKFYPPPLMRFLRSNVGSRSRGRSRSSPLFILRRKTSTAIETQEPSSPKVTCMGQVRVRRSKQPGKKRNGTQKKRRCKWIRNVLFCHQCNGRKLKKTLSFSPLKCLPFFRVGFRSKSKNKEDSSRIGSKFTEKTEDSIQEYKVEDNDDDEDEQEEAKVFASSSSTPPRNALLLTRCRSAPYRSSSLAVRFWGSPEKSEETVQEDTKTEQEDKEEETPTWRKESACRNSDPESKTDPESDDKPGIHEEFKRSIEMTEEVFVKSENAGNSKTEEPETVRPLILTRCKSEPARSGEKLDPELYFWRKRRLGFT